MKDLSLEISAVNGRNSNTSKVFAIHLKPILKIHIKKIARYDGAGEMRCADFWGSLANQHSAFGDFQVHERLCMKNNNNKSGR